MHIVGLILGFTNIVLELDFICIYQFISQGIRDTHMCAPIVNAVRKLMEDADAKFLVLAVSPLSTKKYNHPRVNCG